MPIVKKCLNVKARTYKPSNSTQPFKVVKGERSARLEEIKNKLEQEEAVKNEEQPKKKAVKKDKRGNNIKSEEKTE